MKILLIAYYFPPDSSSGSLRPLFFANHLTKMGDEVTILTVQEKDFLISQPVDQNLSTKLDQRVRVVRAAARWQKKCESFLRMESRLSSKSNLTPMSAVGVSIKRRSKTQWFKPVKRFVANLITTPDHHAGWITSCIRQGVQVIRSQKPDVILVTGGPWSGLLAGSFLKWKTKVPLVLDFRDPWIENQNHTQRQRLFRSIDAWLERRVVVDSANFIIANTEALKHNFLGRYKRLSTEQIATITNGFENYLPEYSQRTNNTLTLLHAGALYYSRNPRPLLEAMRNIIERDRIDPVMIKLRFLGELEVDDPNIDSILASPALASCVELIPRVTYEESLQAMGESDVLILYQPGFPLQVPRKLYDYMAVRRPLLCIAEPGSATRLLVERYALGIACENNTTQLEASLLKMYDQWRSGALKPFADDRCEPFRNHNLSVQLRNCLRQVASTDKTRAA